MLKYIRLILILLVLTHIAGAQDLIIFSNVDEILAKVTIIEEEVINYKKFNNLSGPSYIADKSKLFMIKFENGTKEVFVEQVKSNQQEPSGVATFYFCGPR